MPDQLTRPAPFELDPADVRPDASTRVARIKWVMVIDTALAPGLAANTAGCLAAAVGGRVPGILGPDGTDATGHSHPGLPWTGCSVLGADAATLRRIREKAAGKDGLLVVDMPRMAQTSRVYEGYLETLAGADPAEIEYSGISVLGPRNKVDKIVGRLPLLGAAPAAG
ncbi:DUF2000 domain-containing protein [Marinitenerispora sediminis]|uniref:DUF2000 domain-containing protein n=1 Tax=Marinitenerispora sediminis TaxID=1931232 RepID=A0A368T8Y2_9ACTN|nr:DUF2000 domain-containing protein [Marinitenerispora sediminis]RCV60343.1 DUF2000 domain-containing protein [Marinitenerispora sediminis]RCV60596.1 DUF2000 domain-containing protein [Marinitenerispora sediminis]